VLAKSALNAVPATSRMLPGEWTLNPYRGCTHACAYCFARPTHRHLGFDIGRDFDSELIVKVNIADVLARELATKRTLPERVAFNTSTDPYQRAEGRYRLMPPVIDALARSGISFSILTKGTVIRRDLDRLATAAGHVNVELGLSIAYLDETLRRSLEPGAPATAARLDTLRAMREAGFAPTVFVAPTCTPPDRRRRSPIATSCAPGSTAPCGVTVCRCPPLPPPTGSPCWGSVRGPRPSLRRRHCSEGLARTAVD
jgi:DNA repair photolyase